MMLEVIEHLADIPHMLGEIARVMRPGAVAIVTTPNRLNVSLANTLLAERLLQGTTRAAGV